MYLNFSDLDIFNSELITSKQNTVEDFKKILITTRQPKKIEIYDFQNIEIQKNTPLDYLFQNDFIINLDDLYCHVHIANKIDYNQIYTNYYDNTYKGISPQVCFYKERI